MAEIYKRFAKDYSHCDFSGEAALAMYLHENGKPLPETDKPNGFAVGKKWMNVTIQMWKEDIQNNLLFVWELSKDYPEWFLKKIGILN